MSYFPYPQQEAVWWEELGDPTKRKIYYDPTKAPGEWVTPPFEYSDAEIYQVYLSYKREDAYGDLFYYSGEQLLRINAMNNYPEWFSSDFEIVNPQSEENGECPISSGFVYSTPQLLGIQPDPEIWQGGDWGGYRYQIDGETPVPTWTPTGPIGNPYGPGSVSVPSVSFGYPQFWRWFRERQLDTQCIRYVYTPTEHRPPSIIPVISLFGGLLLASGAATLSPRKRL